MHGAAADYALAEQQDGVSGEPAPAAGLHPYHADIFPAGEAETRLAARWTELAAHAAEPNAFAEPWFVAPGLRHLGSAADIRMVAVWNGSKAGGELIGLVALHVCRSYGRIPVPHLQNWAHFQSFLGTPLVRSGHEQAFWTAALEALDKDPWAASFLHLSGLAEDGPVLAGLEAATRALGRPCEVVHRFERALLESELSPQLYYEHTVRKKKRKELKRLSSRLAELGPVETRTLSSADELNEYCDQFLELERSGWKGEAGSALACDASTERFFRDVVANAFRAGKLDFLRLDLGCRPIAMLVNFLTPPGSFSFKIAFDEEYARFSPGVLIQIENYRILDRSDIAWMDSCAAEHHPMINSLWGERRQIVRVTIPSRGRRRKIIFNACHAAERASAALKRLRGQSATAARRTMS